MHGNQPTALTGHFFFSCARNTHMHNSSLACDFDLADAASGSNRVFLHPCRGHTWYALTGYFFFILAHETHSRTGHNCSISLVVLSEAATGAARWRAVPRRGGRLGIVTVCQSGAAIQRRPLMRDEAVRTNEARHRTALGRSGPQASGGNHAGL
jgi:hypothetical protein